MTGNPSHSPAIVVPPEFCDIQESLKMFSLDSFNDAKKAEEYVSLFSLRAICRPVDADKARGNVAAIERTVSPTQKTPCEPEYRDLCRLHWIALSRKVLNVLEFGSGYSTVVLADAMRRLYEYFGGWAQRSVRSERPFHVYSVEEDQRFLGITNARLGNGLRKFATVSCSSVDMVTHDSRIASVYSKLPNISPDFIYLDGPSQFATTQELNGFSFCSKSRMPMSADILRVEYFLEPGTLILVDGRTANARFLKTYLRRNWVYRHDVEGDVHFFELQENPLGPFNKVKMEFCLGGKWLLA